MLTAQSFQNYWDHPDSNHFNEFGKIFHQLLTPIDLAFHPDQDNRPNELWVLNQGTASSGGHTTIFTNATSDNPIHQYVKDGNAWHFMALASSLDFGDNGNWATAQDIKDANRQGGTFTGPTLWSSDLSIYGVIGNPPTSQYNGSHLDMVHQTPYGKGIAHESGNAYWVFDGWSQTLTRYDFVDDHGPGQHYHGDAILYVYNEISVQPDATLPSHMDLDKESGWLYVAHTAGSEIIRVDVNSGQRDQSITQVTAFETIADYASFSGVTFETVVSTGLQKPVGIEYHNGYLIVTDNASGEIIIYDAEDNFKEMTRMSVPYSNSDLMGVTVGPDNMIYFVDYSNSKAVRIENSFVYPIGIEETEEPGFVVAPNPTMEGHTTIFLEEMGMTGSVLVRDITGRVVRQEAVNGQNRVSINMNGLTRGTYLVELQDTELGTIRGSSLLVH